MMLISLLDLMLLVHTLFEVFLVALARRWLLSLGRLRDLLHVLKHDFHVLLVPTLLLIHLFRDQGSVPLPRV